jgi:hypothetical protein
MNRNIPDIGKRVDITPIPAKAIIAPQIKYNIYFND